MEELMTSQMSEGENAQEHIETIYSKVYDTSLIFYEANHDKTVR